ncbi:helix-turn-helix domain-containing protein [Nitrosomonas sp.]|uniref:helix-turn-helix domain-containing protein n=1 Tax=Nitrosomonas sp. TaxID=42353 RepID=UPI0025F8F820|nr:helix-turn-helix domain-containing protein [Nitrosomonas sp.]MCC6915900.1 helix-turn-helix domain-containing protein [Nitrosomonas sp.]
MKNDELDDKTDELRTDQESAPAHESGAVRDISEQIAIPQVKHIDSADTAASFQSAPAENSAGAEKVNTAAPVSGFGQLLHDERIRCGMSISEVARHLRLSEQQVEAIEAQDFSRLPAAVFLRGYIRNYANLLRLGEVPLLMEAVPQARPVDTVFTGKRNSQRFKAIEPAYRSDRGGRAGWLYVVVILAAFAAYAIYREEIPEHLVSFSPENTDQVIPLNSGEGSDQVAIDLALPLSSPSAELPLTPPALVTPAPSGASLPSVAATLPEIPAPLPAADAPGAANDGKKSLHLSFSRESWVKIKDSSGRVILEKTHARGTEQTIEARPPLYLVIGNAAGVSLVYNGRKVDLAPYTRGNDDVARFSLE